VQLQTEKQRLAADRGALMKDKMVLAREIGLSIDDDFDVAEILTGDLEPELTLPDAYQRALNTRNDLRAAEAQLKAAVDARQAAGLQRIPSLKVQGFYGLQGVDPNSGSTVYNGQAQLNIPIFNGGQIRSDERQADAALDQRKSELADTREQVRFDVRSAWIDRDVAANQVLVADSNRKLAAETLKQSADRFFAGATTAVEVVQSEQSVADAERDYIGSLFSLNVAKINLARAMGEAEKDVPVVLKGAQ
jgi:outer membrane protein TolC